MLLALADTPCRDTEHHMHSSQQQGFAIQHLIVEKGPMEEVDKSIFTYSFFSPI